LEDFGGCESLYQCRARMSEERKRIFHRCSSSRLTVTRWRQGWPEDFKSLEELLNAENDPGDSPAS
jgi:hypothetical protein